MTDRADTADGDRLVPDGGRQLPDGGPQTAELSHEVEYNFTGSVVVAVLAGVGLAWPARAGAVDLLIATAVVQGLLAFAWVFALRLPGRIGALVIAAMTSAAADVLVSVWPQSRLGTLLAVLALAIPAMFVHQLLRGAARVRMVDSLGGIALLVIAEVSLPALLQLRHEFAVTHVGTDVVFAVICVGAGALVVGYLVDLTFAAPRFDAEVPRGLPGVLASAAAGAALGQLTLRDSPQFADGRCVFVGAALGAIVALLAIAVAFIEYEQPVSETTFGRRARPVLSVLFPLSVLAPVAFLICLAVRT